MRHSGIQDQFCLYFVVVYFVALFLLLSQIVAKKMKTIFFVFFLFHSPLGRRCEPMFSPCLESVGGSSPSCQG